MIEWCSLSIKPVDEVPESDGPDFGDCFSFPGCFCENCPFYCIINTEALNV